jgi:hypothetical protein
MNDFSVVAAIVMGVIVGQPPHEHGEISRPRVGVMSEQVVRQKLTSYGFTIVKLERVQEKLVAQVDVDGRAQTLEFDLLTGSVAQNGAPARLQPTAKALPLAIKPDPRRVPWMERTIRFDKIGVEGIRVPAVPK